MFHSIIFCFLLSQIVAVPISKNKEQADFFCESLNSNEKSDKTYVFDYETNTTLWLNGNTEQTKSLSTMRSTVKLSSTGSCTYQIRMSDSSLSGESLKDTSLFQKELDSYSVEFRLNNGVLHSKIKFHKEDSQWSRNIKRGIISTFQVKTEASLRSLNELDWPTEKSATVYETDILGRCRTTYKIKPDSSSDNQFTVNKVKSLQSCTLNENFKSSDLNFVPYKTIPVI